METKLSKDLIVLIVKHCSWITGTAYVIAVLLSCFGIQATLLCWLFGVSVIPSILLCLFSKFLGFCIWNRLPLYLALLLNMLNAIDYYWLLLPNKLVLSIYLIIIGMFILYGSYVKNKNNVNKRNSKEIVT